MKRPFLRLFSVLALAATAWLGARCTASSPTQADVQVPAPRPAAARPDILLISVDTLRADHLSSYGHKRPTSPYLDGLAAQGVRFARAYSTSSWTVPSLVSLITSSYPSRHGMGESARKGKREWGIIPQALPTLAEMLKEQGYRTYGLTANFGLPIERGFGRGFGRYHCVGAVDRDVVKAALDPWLADLHSGSPWFVWLHLFDPHAPYTPRERFMPQMWSAPRDDLRKLDALQADKLPILAQKFSPEALDYVRALYDSEIRDTDDYIREVVERFPREREPIVVLTADHGEEFMEHGGMLHGRTLNEESIRVPLIVRFPDRRLAGTVVEDPVSLVDVVPTVLAAVGLAPRPGLAGIGLFGPHGPAVPAGRSVVAELERGSVIRASVGRRFKLIHDTAHPERSALYDLANDPGERHDVAREQAAEFARLEALLVEFARQNPNAASEGQTPITPEQLEALRNLGYIN